MKHMEFDIDSDGTVSEEEARVSMLDVISTSLPLRPSSKEEGAQREKQPFEKEIETIEMLFVYSFLIW